MQPDRLSDIQLVCSCLWLITPVLCLQSPRMWVVSWCANFAGCAIFVGLMYGSGVYEGRDW